MQPRAVARIRLLKNWRDMVLITGREQEANAPYPKNLKIVTSCSPEKYPKFFAPALVARILF